MLDTDTESDHIGCDTRQFELFLGKLPMRR